MPVDQGYLVALCSRLHRQVDTRRGHTQHGEASDEAERRRERERAPEAVVLQHPERDRRRVQARGRDRVAHVAHRLGAPVSGREVGDDCRCRNGTQRQSDSLEHSGRYYQPYVDCEDVKQGRDSHDGDPGKRDPLGSDAVHPLPGERPDHQPNDAERPDDYPKLPVCATALDDVQRDERKHRRVRREDAVRDDQVENEVAGPETGGGVRGGGQVRGACKEDRLRFTDTILA